jgi:sugar lactone lactonase YvrE
MRLIEMHEEKSMLRLIRCIVFMTIFACIAGCGGGSGSPPQLVSITLQTTKQVVPLGGGAQFSAIGTYSDGSSADVTASATWSSSNTAVATISSASGSKGAATSVAGGSATITAALGGVSGSAAMSVVPVGGGSQGVPLALTGVVTTLPGSTAQFNLPMGVTTDGVNLYVADSNNNQIKKIVLSTAAISTMVCTDQRTGTAVSFNHPDSITTDGTYLYVVESQNNNPDGNVRKIDKVTGVSASFASSVVLNSPAGITTDGINLYVTDAANNSIHMIVISTGVISTLAGSVSDPPGTADGTGAAARFSSPVGITTDGNNLYVTDFGNHTIRKIVIASREVSTLTGTPGVFGSSDGDKNSALFKNPRGISTDGTNLYVTDYNNHTIRSVVISSGAVTTLAGTVSVSGAYADGSGTAALFKFPEGLTSDGARLYIADSSNNAIRIMK